MGLPELVDALEEEVERQIRDVDEQARKECDQLAAESEAAIAAERDAALARERERLDEERARACAALRASRERTLLADKRRLLAGLEEEVARRANELDAHVLLPRLVDEIAGEVGAAPVRFRVGAGQVDLVRRHLEHRHPGLAGRAAVVEDSSLGGGVVVDFEGGALDNTLASRQRRLWPLVEGRVASMLFDERGPS